MKQRTALKVLNTANYYQFFENPENGKVCYYPKPKKYGRRIRKACEKLGVTDVFWENVNKRVKEAFDTEE